jgi:uncharacterized protein YndB with AHSA1/START domain
MTETAVVVRTVEVGVDPDTAFSVFTDEIGEWYRSSPYSWNDASRAIGIRFDGGVGGRLIEVWRDADGEGFEIGRILGWEPGRRLVFQFRNALLPPVATEVEVRFEALSTGTRVTLEHRGLERLPAEEGERMRRFAWISVMQWFSEYVAARGAEAL